MKWLLILIFAYLAKAQLINDGKCPEMHVLQNLNKEKALGKWYTIQSYTNKQEANLICGLDEYTSWEGNVLIGFAHAIDKKSREKLKIPYNATLESNSDAAKFVTSYSVREDGSPMKIQIIDTDYDDYLILWSCNENQGKSETYVWLNSRSRTFPEKIRDKINGLIKTYNLDSTALTDMEQDNC